MKPKDVIRQQQTLVSQLAAKARAFAGELPKDQLSAILLSGSVARGDFFPGAMGGMVDVTVFTTPASRITAEELFGPNQEPQIPYHCIRRGGTWFQIWFTHAMDAQEFSRLPEARKFALLESRLLWQRDGVYDGLLRAYIEAARVELASLCRSRLGYAHYLVSDYKVDRWTRRDEPGQLHANLNEAISTAVACLYNLNGKYAPAADRMLYYSLELERKPPDWERLLPRVMTQDHGSMGDFRRRLGLFREGLLSFLEQRAAQ